MKLRRKLNVGIHRVIVPGYGWKTIKPGEEVPGEHETVDFLGSEKLNYIATSGEMPKDPEPEVEPSVDYAMYPKKVEGGYNVINSATKKPVNSKPITAADARKLLDISDNDCPLKEGTFGKDFDEFENCSDCMNYDGCKKASRFYPTAAV